MASGRENVVRTFLSGRVARKGGPVKDNGKKIWSYSQKNILEGAEQGEKTVAIRKEEAGIRVAFPDLLLYIDPYL